MVLPNVIDYIILWYKSIYYIAQAGYRYGIYFKEVVSIYTIY